MKKLPQTPAPRTPEGETTRIVSRLGRPPADVAIEMLELLGYVAENVDALAEGDILSPEWNMLRSNVLDLVRVANEVASLTASPSTES